MSAYSTWTCDCASPAETTPSRCLHTHPPPLCAAPTSGFSHPLLPLDSLARSAGGTHSHTACLAALERRPFPIAPIRNGCIVWSCRRGIHMSSESGWKNWSRASRARSRSWGEDEGVIPHREGPITSAQLEMRARTARPREDLSEAGEVGCRVESA